jgi:hypothetical protein
MLHDFLPSLKKRRYCRWFEQQRPQQIAADTSYSNLTLGRITGPGNGRKQLLHKLEKRPIVSLARPLYLQGANYFSRSID